MTCDLCKSMRLRHQFLNTSFFSFSFVLDVFQIVKVQRSAKAVPSLMAAEACYRPSQVRKTDFKTSRQQIGPTERLLTRFLLPTKSLNFPLKKSNEN